MNLMTFERKDMERWNFHAETDRQEENRNFRDPKRQSGSEEIRKELGTCYSSRHHAVLRKLAKSCQKNGSWLLPKQAFFSRTDGKWYIEIDGKTIISKLGVPLTWNGNNPNPCWRRRYEKTKIDGTSCLIL